MLFRSATNSFTITLTGTNDAPVATFTTAQDATEGGSSITGQLTSTDVDLLGTTATYALDGAPIAGLTINTDGSWSFDPADAAYDYLAKDQTLEITVNYSVTDNNDASATNSFTITLTGTNDAPVATFTTAQDATEGEIGRAHV